MGDTHILRYRRMGSVIDSLVVATYPFASAFAKAGSRRDNSGSIPNGELKEK